MAVDHTRAPDEADQISAALQGPTASTAVALADGGLPLTAGFYAWWAPRQVLEQVPVYPHPLEDVRLLYVGIAPGRDPAKVKAGSPLSTLRSRVRDQHIAGNTGSSTLKLMLAALLLEERGYRPERRNRKTVLNPHDRLDLRHWQETELRLTWTKWPRPWKDSVEAEVIKLMKPPLNWQHNRAHPYWPHVDDARRRFRNAAL
jgi:hypothetical protein